MRAVVIFESMFGNTRAIADAIGEGLAPRYEVDVQAAADVGIEQVRAANLVVVGGPTHAWSMSRPSTRQGAVDQAVKPGSGLHLESSSGGMGVREWIDSLGGSKLTVATFDTRVKLPAVLTGRAGKKIARALKRHGCRVIAKPESFFVTKQNLLVDGELERARVWGRQLAATNIEASW